MLGKRHNLSADDSALAIGEYGLYDGHWLAMTPTGMLAGLDKHQVTEHADGTITVSPSILVTDWKGAQWHGFLERGVWRDA